MKLFSHTFEYKYLPNKYMFIVDLLYGNYEKVKYVEALTLKNVMYTNKVNKTKFSQIKNSTR